MSKSPSLQRRGRDVTAVWIRLRAELRLQWRSWLTLALFSGLAAGLVIATAAGARRTDSAVARYRAAAEVFDVWVARGELWDLKMDFSLVERLPQVAQATRSIDLAFWGRTESGRPVTVTEAELNVAINGRDGARNDPKFIAGRAPDPARADELYVGSAAADQYDLQIGSTLRVRVATPREVTRIDATGEHDVYADPQTAGTGPLLTLRVVGIAAEVQSEDALGWMSVSPAFHDRYGQKVGAWSEFTGVRLKRGDADLDAFRAGVERIADGRPVGVYPYRNWITKLQNSIHLQARALWLLAALGGLAALLLVGQALARQTALESNEYPLLRSLGMTRRQLFALGLLRVAPVAAVAGVLAAGVAAGLSPLAPIGAARTAEPDPGLDLAPLVWAGGAATAALVLLVALLPAWRVARTRLDQAGPRSLAAVAVLARAGLPPAGVSGIRMALEPGRGRTAVPVGSTLLGAVVGVTAIAATLTITASADHLLSTPRLYGQNWDAVIGDGTEPKYPKRFVARLGADRSIAELAAGTIRDTRVEGEPTGVLALAMVRGSLSPTVVEGRQPAAAGEILLGTKTARALEAEIGDEVEGRTGKRVSKYRVVGRGVLPDFGVHGAGTLALGNGAAMTLQGVRRLEPQAAPNVFLLGLAATANRRATLARLQRDVLASVPGRPADVANWGRVSAFPYALAALVAAAAAALLAHALLTSIRRRRRDLAILKTLGFERRDVRATVAWQATTVAAIGLLVGLPLGAATGRFAWNLFAAELGVAPEPVVPLWSGLLVIPAALLLANLVALLPGRIAAGTRPALVLRAE
jgi:hypothetical protein